MIKRFKMNIHLQPHAFLHQIIRSIQDFIGFSQDHIVFADIFIKYNRYDLRICLTKILCQSLKSVFSPDPHDLDLIFLIGTN